MRIINLEDTAEKHRAICRELERNGYEDIDWVLNLEDGIEKIQEAIEVGNPYAFAVSDMYYPLYSGGGDAEGGEELLKKLKELGIDLPVIIVSSNNLIMPEAFGTVYYSENRDWEDELMMFVKRLQT